MVISALAAIAMIGGLAFLLVAFSGARRGRPWAGGDGSAGWTSSDGSDCAPGSASDSGCDGGSDGGSDGGGGCDGGGGDGGGGGGD
jgi:hypothetical protein